MFKTIKKAAYTGMLKYHKIECDRYKLIFDRYYEIATKKMECRNPQETKEFNACVDKLDKYATEYTRSMNRMQRDYDNIIHLR